MMEHGVSVEGNKFYTLEIVSNDLRFMFHSDIFSTYDDYKNFRLLIDSDVNDILSKNIGKAYDALTISELKRKINKLLSDMFAAGQLVKSYDGRWKCQTLKS